MAIFNLDATGDPRFSRALFDGSPDVDGLASAFDLTVSSDGRHVYVAGSGDNAVTFLTRDASTGVLAVGAVYRDGAGDGSGNVVDGLESPLSVALSPDGSNLYAVGNASDTLAVFNRNPTTGSLTFATFFKDGTDDVDGLEGAFELVVSPDGKNVYAVGDFDNALAVFNRNPTTGSLTFARLFENIRDLIGPRYLTVSPDGKSLYVSAISRESLTDFDRDAATGELTLHESIVVEDLPAVFDPRGYVFSSDEKTVYVVARNGILRFSREVR